MAVLNNLMDDELVINCKCGCDEGIHIKIDCDDPDDYALMTFTNGNFYKEQGSGFLSKLKKIWAIIRNKDFYYSDIRMTKEDLYQFILWMQHKYGSYDSNYLEMVFDMVQSQGLDIGITIESKNGTVTAKLLESLVYIDKNGNLIIDAE